MVANWFSLCVSVKNNANRWKGFPLGVSRLCSCSMQMHEAWSWSKLPQFLNVLHYREGWISVDGNLRRETHVKDLPPQDSIFTQATKIRYTYTSSRTFLPWTYTYKLDQSFVLTGSNAQAVPHTWKETAWCEMVWLHEVYEQQQPEAGEMTGRKAFLSYEKGVSTPLLWSSRDMSGAKSPCLHL